MQFQKYPEICMKSHNELKTCANNFKLKNPSNMIFATLSTKKKMSLGNMKNNSTR